MAAFLAGSGWGGARPAPLAGDASFRRYYRLGGDGRRAVLMDAPPPQEDVVPYIAVAQLLRRLGFSAPEVFADDRARGFLLIEDFGDDTYTRLLDRGADEPALYALAVDTLIELQRAVEARGNPDLPPYDAERLLAEAALLVDWYAPAALGEPLSDARRDEYLDLWRSASAASGASRRYLGAARLSRRQSDAVAGSLRRAGLRAPRFSGRGMRPAELRSRLAPRRCAARRSGRAAPADDRALSCCFSGARPGGVPAIGGHPRGSAQLQDPRHLHAIVEARRQTALPRTPPADLAAARSRARPPGPHPDCAVARPSPAARRLGISPHDRPRRGRRWCSPPGSAPGCGR